MQPVTEEADGEDSDRNKPPPSVRPVAGAADGEDSDEIFQTLRTTALLDDSQLVTLRLNSGSHIQFQVDTGAQCNVVPLEIYKKATGDQALEHVTPAQTHNAAYGGTTLPVVGTTLLRVSRGDFNGQLNCKLVDRQDIRPLLGRKACVGMKIVSYLDNDQLNKPNTGNSPVYAVEETGLSTIKQLINSYPTVFDAS